MFYSFICWFNNMFHSSSHHAKKHRRKKRAYSWNKHSEDLVNGLPERSTCRSRYQQSSVEIYARFLAVDQVIYLYINHFSLNVFNF